MTQYELDVIARGARENLKKSDPLLPTFFIGSPAGMVIVGAQFNTESDKEKVALAIRRMCREANATYVVFLTETWQLKCDTEEEARLAREHYKSLEDHPNAQEKLMITLETFQGVKTGIADILPGREMGEIKWEETWDMQGRFSHFLGPREVK